MANLNRFGEYQTNIPNKTKAQKRQEEILNEIKKMSNEYCFYLDINYGHGMILIDGIINVNDLEYINERIIKLKQEWDSL